VGGGGGVAGGKVFVGETGARDLMMRGEGRSVWKRREKRERRRRKLTFRRCSRAAARLGAVEKTSTLCLDSSESLSEEGEEEERDRMSEFERNGRNEGKKGRDEQMFST